MIKIEGEVVVKDPKLDKSIGAFKSLQNEIKQARNELAGLEAGTEEYSRAAVKVGQLRDQMNDLKDTIAQTSGSPMENLNSSFTILSSQVNNLDFDGVSKSLSTLFTTIAANPLIALAGAVTLVVTNLDKLNSIFDSLSGSAEKNAQAIKEINISIEETSKAIDVLKDKYDNYITLVEASGASYETVAIERVKAYEAEIKELDVLANEYNQLFSLQEEGSEDQKKTEIEYTKIRREQAQLRNKIDLEFVKADKFIRDEAIKQREKANKEAQEREIESFKNLQRIIDEENNSRTQLEKAEAAENQREINEIISQIEAENRENDLTAYLDFEERKQQERLRIERDAAKQARQIREDELEDENKKREAATSFAQAQVNLLTSLNDVVYKNKTENLEKGSKAEQDYARKQFNINKSLGITSAIINGANSILAITSVPDFTLGIATALRIATQATLTAAQIAKISATKFNPTGLGAGSSSSSGSVSAPLSVPNIPLPTAPRTRLDEQGRPINENGERPYVSVKEINKKQERVDVLETRSSY